MSSMSCHAYLCCKPCRARLKQRLEAAQEGVSTEDGSSSVTSGLDEDQALQADIMMRRLVQASTLQHIFTHRDNNNKNNIFTHHVVIFVVSNNNNNNINTNASNSSHNCNYNYTNNSNIMYS